MMNLLIDQRIKSKRGNMQHVIEIGSRGEFGMWAIEVAKQIVAEQGFELARAARDGNEDDIRSAGNALGQAITHALIEVYDGLTDEIEEANACL